MLTDSLSHNQRNNIKNILNDRKTKQTIKKKCCLIQISPIYVA